MSSPVRQTSLRIPYPLDLRLTFGPLWRGRGDPTMRIEGDEMRRATRTPEGPVALHLQLRSGYVEASAWGAGAEWILDRLPDLVGVRDDPSRLQAAHPRVRDLQRRLPGMRIGKTGAVVEALIPAVCEQKVTNREAWRAFRALVLGFSEPAPGPTSIWLPADPAVLAAQPYYSFHPCGIERRKAGVLRLACSQATRLEELSSLRPGEAARVLTSIPGVGVWTAAEVTGRALGDADAVPVGDFHLPHLVSWALEGRPRGDDTRMLDLLEPYRGQRGRVLRLLEAGVSRPPRRGPRMPQRFIERI
jgi:3-methyladenine DNA glycosylase/8-oxoguanine DNA glycosylase